MKMTKVLTCLAAVLVFGTIAININADSAKAFEVSGFYQYESNGSGVTITKYTGGELTVSIPSKIGNKKVTAIGDSAFGNNDLIERVTIPNTVTSIGSGAFYDCDSLQEIAIPNSVTTINSDSGSYEKTFGYCDNLTSVVLGDGLTSIGICCFEECPKLQNVTIGKNVTIIEDFAFHNCESLKNIDIPKSVEIIGDMCFSDCNKLQIIKLNYGLKIIGKGAFTDCGSLQEITIPNSVTTIDSYNSYGTFRDCINLTSVVLGDSLTCIENLCFENCRKLQNVTIGKNVSYIGDSAFYNCDSLQNIEIPKFVQSIGDMCFRDCDSLKKVQIPNSVSNIGDSLFFGIYTDNVVIYGYANSAAAQYAAKNKISFQELPSVPSDKFSFKKSEIHLMAGKQTKLGYTIAPDNTTDAIIWKTSDANIATVDNVGVVIAKSEGSVSIIAATTSGKKGSVTIIVQAAPKNISFKTASNSLAVGQTYTQKAILDDGSRTDISITYSSSDTTIATVNSKGKVTAKKAGTATIRAEIFNGLYTTYQITVYKAPTSVKLTTKKITRLVNETYTLLPILPEGCYTSKYTFKSSNPSIATVSSNGTIVAKKKGSVKITVTTHNGKKAACIVTIK